MILYRVIVILCVVFFTAYADEKLNDIDDKVEECNDNNGSACYELGQYYSQSSEENSTNKTFYYFEKGCASKHEDSCIKEVKLIRDENKKAYNFYRLKCDNKYNTHCVPNLFSLKYENIGDIYSKKCNFQSAYEYYMIAMTSFSNSEAAYKISIMYLNGEGVEKDINKSQTFYAIYVRNVLKNVNFHFGRKMLFKQGNVKIEFIVLENGHIINANLIESSKDNELDQKFIDTIRFLPNLHPIPKEYDQKFLKFIAPFQKI